MAMTRRQRLERVIGAFSRETFDRALRDVARREGMYPLLTDEALEAVAEHLVTGHRNGYAAGQGALTFPSLGTWATVARRRAVSVYDRVQARHRAWIDGRVA